MDCFCVFVYGTLRRGDVRWRLLKPYVVDRGAPDHAAGALYDTGSHYPAALFEGQGIIVGHRYELKRETYAEALAELDEIEGTVVGDYARILITTAAGHKAWTYEYGSDDRSGLTLIPSGDWFQHREMVPDGDR